MLNPSKTTMLATKANPRITAIITTSTAITTTLKITALICYLNKNLNEKIFLVAPTLVLVRLVMVTIPMENTMLPFPMVVCRL